jgi:hypothetical protein
MESISAEAGSKIVASKCMAVVHKIPFGCVCFLWTSAETPTVNGLTDLLHSSDCVCDSCSDQLASV